jgi:hypothetical protein
MCNGFKPGWVVRVMLLPVLVSTGGAAWVILGDLRVHASQEVRGASWWLVLFGAIFVIGSILYAALVEMAANRKIESLRPENLQKLQNENTKQRHLLAKVAAELRNSGKEETARKWGLSPYLGERT